MDKREIALQITLSLIEKNYFIIQNKQPKETGKAAAEMYNAILSDLNVSESQA